MRATAKLRDLRSVGQLPPRPERGPAPVARALQEPSSRPRSRSPFRLVWLLDSLPMRAARRAIAGALGRLLEFAAYGSIALVIGIASAWYMIEAGTRLTVESIGPWRHWGQAGSVDADPYTRAHFARAGWLPLQASAASYFTATRDSNGEPLYSDCNYILSGTSPGARRWTLNAFDLNGALLEAGTSHAIISSDVAIPDPGGGVTISLSQSPKPGNWLATSGASRMQILLTVFGLQQTSAVQSANTKKQSLFRIESAGCS